MLDKHTHHGFSILHTPNEGLSGARLCCGKELVEDQLIVNGPALGEILLFLPAAVSILFESHAATI